ncbi:unnamed protein product [Gongylonema pulchrum]|uniref:DOMON domain-containing protein n=1 Tax=Gongylonema pulchrum TaxID=637853 RepID=A0A183CV91_9BILA|nr:unnamed protein product [Gongylonema pulchrum]
MALQASVQLALSATANASFVVFVSVQKLPTSSIGPKIDMGSYMPTPLLDTKCRGVMDYHVSMLLETEKYVVTQASTCVGWFSVYGESGYEKLYISPPQSKNVLLHKLIFGLNAGVNSSSSMLQVLKYGGNGVPEMMHTSFLDLAVSWSQFVTGSAVFYVPSDNNIITVSCWIFF